MELEYIINIADCLALNNHLINTTPEVKKAIRIGQINWSVWPFIGVFSWTLIKSIPFEMAIIIIVIVTVICSLPAFFLFPIYYKYYNRKHIKKICESGRNKGITGKHIIEITDEYFKEKTEYNDTSIPWHAIDRIESTDDYTFVFSNPTTAYIIPRQSFSSEIYNSCINEMKEKYYKNKG